MYIYNYITCAPLIDCTIGGAKDVVFVIDASNEIGSYQFRKIRELVANITITLKVNSPESSVGVILFNNSASILFNLEARTNLSTLSPAINPGLPYNYDYRYGNDRDTAAALDFLLSSARDGSLEIRNETSNIAIVITGGRSDSNYSIQSAAAALHAANIFDVYAIGFGRADINELNTIASDPNFVYFTYYDFQELQMNVENQLCSSKKPILMLISVFEHVNLSALLSIYSAYEQTKSKFLVCEYSPKPIGSSIVNYCVNALISSKANKPNLYLFLRLTLLIAHYHAKIYN